MDDSTRAASVYKVGRKELEALVECYRQRKYVEDLEYIAGTLKGVNNLLDALDVDPDHGVTSISLTDRERAFGTHYKDPP